MATYLNGDVYEGNFLRGKRQGNGTMRYATGEEASGNWTDGALESQTSQAGAAEEPAAATDGESSGATTTDAN